MKLLDLIIKRNNKVRCYSYCIGLKYDRCLKKTKRQWEKTDVDAIAKIVLDDLKKLKIPAKIVSKNYRPFITESLIALRVSILWMGGDYYHDVDYHMVVKKQDGHWYSKFNNLPPERLSINTNIELWDWRDNAKTIQKNYYNSKIVYIAVKC